MDLKARRKAREMAWYLLWLRPRGVEEHRVLVRALAAPEEAVARLCIVKKARALAPGDAELERSWAEGCAFLGWKR